MNENQPFGLLQSPRDGTPAAETVKARTVYHLFPLIRTTDVK